VTGVTRSSRFSIRNRHRRRDEIGREGRRAKTRRTS
jgi:hypothetical protein